MPLLPFYLILLIIFSALSFLFFGFACLFTSYMVLEFERYGLQNYRVLNGYLQLMGALALFAGLFYVPLGLIGSLGRSLVSEYAFALKMVSSNHFQLFSMPY